MLKAKNRLGIVFFPAFDWAISSTHPEREERLLYTQDQLWEEGVFDIPGIVEYPPALAAHQDVARAHLCVPDLASRVTESHLIAAGAAINLGEAWARREIDKAFAIIRPPGHHAMRIVHGSRGFCTINNEAILAEYLRTKYNIKRIAIIDTDCHHGDGTQDIYWHDPDTLFISLHQDGRTLYPGSGFPHEMGGPNAYGYTLNVPLPPGTSDAGFHFVIDNLVLPVLADFKPDLIINSAGQDNHYSDPLTNMKFSAQGYARLTEMLQPDIAVLEGGYSIEGALPYVNLGILLALAGVNYSHVKEPDFLPRQWHQSPDITGYIEKLCRGLWDRWQYREELRREAIKDKDFLSRSRHIYYDTDGISEDQEEKARICDRCPGWTELHSSSDWGGKAIGVLVHRRACPGCREEALAAYNVLQKKGSLPFLQEI
ncbi:MAG: histone deacetylase [Bacillota bacterium]